MITFQDADTSCEVIVFFVCVSQWYELCTIQVVNIAVVGLKINDVHPTNQVIIL